jgi:RNA polymerase sigma factor (sigma-70 family)
VEDHLSLVDGIARRIHASLPLGAFDLDDLIATGNLALTHAANRYRPRVHNGTPFSAFARHVVRGAILNSISRKNWHEATRPGIEPIAIDEDRTEAMRALERAACPADQDQQIDSRRRIVRLKEAISWLPAEQRQVLLAYYSREEYRLTEVSEQLGISYERTRDLHNEALRNVRMRLETSGAFTALRPAA